jgi:hypothetical protein
MFALPFQLLYLYGKSDNRLEDVAGIQTRQAEDIVNWIAIGDYRFTLFGYTSPFAVVSFDGQGIHDQTISDSTGYFEMANRFSPFSPREACLSSKDQFGRISSPVCLPTFPTMYTVSIGPVLIPPTISLDRDVYYIDDQVKLSGQTIPDSEVNLSVFTKNGQSLSLVRPVDAYSFPDLTAKSDQAGNFSLSLPSSNSQSFRLFAQTDFKNDESGESIKLNFKVHPVWMVIVRFFQFLIEAIKARLLEIIIAMEIIYLFWVMSRYWFHPHLNRAIMLRPEEPIMVSHTDESIVVYEEPPVLAKED